MDNVKQSAKTDLAGYDSVKLSAKTDLAGYVKLSAKTDPEKCSLLSQIYFPSEDQPIFKFYIVGKDSVVVALSDGICLQYYCIAFKACFMSYRVGFFKDTRYCG